MYSLVEQWKQSDLTKAAFSASKSLSYHQFNYWLKKYKKEMDSEQPEPDVSFFSVAQNPVKEKKQSAPKLKDRKTMRIDLPGGITITIYWCWVWVHTFAITCAALWWICEKVLMDFRDWFGIIWTKTLRRAMFSYFWTNPKPTSNCCIGMVTDLRFSTSDSNKEGLIFWLAIRFQENSKEKNYSWFWAALNWKILRKKRDTKQKKIQYKSL